MLRSVSLHWNQVPYLVFWTPQFHRAQQPPACTSISYLALPFFTQNLTWSWTSACQIYSKSVLEILAQTVMIADWCLRLFVWLCGSRVSRYGPHGAGLSSSLGCGWLECLLILWVCVFVSWSGASSLMCAPSRSSLLSAKLSTIYIRRSLDDFWVCKGHWQSHQ